MPTLSTLNRSSWLLRASIVTALAACLSSYVLLVAWGFRIDGLLLPLGIEVPMRFNTALCFAVLCTVLLLNELRLRAGVWLALSVVALAGFTLCQDIVGVNLSIDQFFVKDHVLSASRFPGRMPPPISAALTFASLTILWLAIPKFRRFRTVTMAMAGSLMVSIGISTLLGYALNLPGVYRWGTESAASPVTAIVLLLTGASVLMVAARENLADELGAPSWLPLPVVVGSTTLSLILWLGLREREQVYLATNTQIAITSLAGEVNLDLERQQNSLERIARSWAQDEGPNINWEVDAATFKNDAGPGCVSVSFVGADAVTQWFYPEAANVGLIAFNHVSDPNREIAMEIAAKRRKPSVTNSIEIGGRGPGFAIYSPVLANGTLRGYVAAEYVYLGFIAALDHRLQLSENYLLRVNIAQDSIYHSADALGVINRNTMETVFSIYDRRLRIILTPRDEYLERNRRFLPELALVAGFGITCLLGLSVHLARTANTGLRSAEISNRRLLSENEERRRVEAMLKVSDERLRLALDSTQIGIFEWNLVTNQRYYSPGLWTMLGYQPGQIASSAEAWEKLVHPEDLDSYRHATEQQLMGLETFIEPEYRVHSGANEWRWLYARARTVARGADNLPTRVIGTIQDITDRKLAEEALRASQATARKLSQVASRTDNLVIIGAPDGTIEWVNESFTRVMGFTLDEVVGRNPAEFMVGRDTNPRTLRRIGAAMSKGVGITTDVINYSKSGRKFHLHLEIQPVRNEHGNLETFIAMLADITARVETETALRQAKQEADATSRAKSEFLASMSHEIRTPMNGVIGMTSLLMETSLNHEQRDFVNTIRSSGEALLTIINDILDFSKIESGKLELEHYPYDLNATLEETLDLFSVTAAAKKLDLAFHLDDDVPTTVFGDAARLRQVLVNLINNAVKFTPGGLITIEGSLRGETDPLPGIRSDEKNRPKDIQPSGTFLQLEFRVTDTGIGIPADRVNRLFKPFSQVDSSTTRKYGGTGLGLAICHRLCELMGGNVSVHSVEGQGSIFTFTVTVEAPNKLPKLVVPKLPPALLKDGLLLVEPITLNRRHFDAIFKNWGVALRHVDETNLLATLQSGARPGAILLPSALLESADAQDLREFTAQKRIPLIVTAAPGHLIPRELRDDQRAITVPRPVRSPTLLRSLQEVFEADSRMPFTQRDDSMRLGEDLPLKMLLVEDNPVNQKVALRFLNRIGYTADAVANGLEGVNAAESTRYDLILMDLQMPEMDGFEASRQIRLRLPADRQPKIIALTANALQGDREACLQAGMDDYIAKPVKLPELIAAIERQFRKPDSVDSAENGDAV